MTTGNARNPTFLGSQHTSIRQSISSVIRMLQRVRGKTGSTPGSYYLVGLRLFFLLTDDRSTVELMMTAPFSLTLTAVRKS